MSAQYHSSYGISPEEVQILIRAARAERAQAIHRALWALFRRYRESSALRVKTPDFGPSACR